MLTTFNLNKEFQSKLRIQYKYSETSQDNFIINRSSTPSKFNKVQLKSSGANEKVLSYSKKP